MKLVIVESPTKCTTIQRYLGPNYIVKASLGHIRDLSTKGKGGLGVDVDNNFAPSYIINKDKGGVVKELSDLAKKADEVILATDPDREGEAIAWHLSQVLGLNVDTNKRLEFHEITRDSITEAMKKPRTIDMDLVASQETRRILDRIIGFKLSTLLYRKIKSKSAGRVQSATLKLIFERDEEIAKFVPQEYWNILTEISLSGHIFKLTFKGPNGKSIEIKNKEQADKILSEIPDELTVTNVKKSVKVVESREPFTTSTMQQEAFSKLKFKTKKTQMVAQSLYEGIEVDGEHVGLITYMRTDSTHLSDTFVNRANKYIEETYGSMYIGKRKKGKTSDMAQEAHEAIRPTSNHRTPESVRKYLTNDQYALYKLIYNRTIASLMVGKKEEVCDVTLSGNNYQFNLELSRILFKGFTVIYGDDADKEYVNDLPVVNKGDVFKLVKKNNEQKFTQPPSHYSEAKLVKTMEEIGIGRPSTYASTIDLIKSRKYVEDKGGFLSITEQGKKTCEYLIEYFPDIIDANYTAQMETSLDTILDGSETRNSLLSNFYYPFINEVETAGKTRIGPGPVVGTCPVCGGPLYVKQGKNGTFIGCGNYPQCRYVQKEEKDTPKEVGRTCPQCGKPLVERVDRRGRKFIACSGYPSCTYTEQLETKESKTPVVVKKCPKCGADMIKKKGKYGMFLGCSNYPNCQYMEKITRAKRK